MALPGDPGYRIIVEDDEFRLALHVFARAYRDACVALTGRLPSGTHRFEQLDLAIEYPDAERAN